MKLLLISLIAILLVGCQDGTVVPLSPTRNTYTFQGCEYISFDRSLTHKGNCTNPIHRCNK